VQPDKKVANHVPESNPSAVVSNAAPDKTDDANAELQELETAELLPQGIIRSEVNFLVLPFFALSGREAHGKTETQYSATVSRGDQRVEISWSVSANTKYGYPGPFDRIVHKAIEQIISELKPPLENPIPLGSLRGLSRRTGLVSHGGWQEEKIRTALKRITATTVESSGTFYSKGRKRWIEEVFHLYEQVVFTGEELPGGQTADKNYLFLSRWYLENVNARYVKPLDYAYYRSLSNHLASRLYELLGVKFFGMRRLPFIRYKYSTLCQLLPVTRQQYASDAKRILHPTHQELIHTGFFSQVEWDNIPGERHDWYVTYWPGPRAREEIQRLPRQLPLTIEAVRGTIEDSEEDSDPSPPGDEYSGDQPAAMVVTTVQAKPSRKKPAKGKSELTETQQELVKQMEGLGVSRISVGDLVRQADPQSIRNWIKVIENDESIQDRPAYLVKALREDWQLPESFHRKEAQRREAEHQEQERKRRENCSICQGQGFYQVAKNTVAMCEHKGPKKKTTPKGQGPDTNAVWDQALEKLRGQVPKLTYESWLKDVKFFGLDGSTAVIAAPSQFVAERLERVYQVIARALGDVLGQQVEVEVVVNQDTEGSITTGPSP
jgi:hypothetical protein